MQAVDLELVVTIAGGKFGLRTSIPLEDGRNQVHVLRALEFALAQVKAWDPPESAVLTAPASALRHLNGGAPKGA